MLVEMIFKKTAYVIYFKRFGKIDFKCIAIKKSHEHQNVLFEYKCIYNIVNYYDWVLMPLIECYPSYSS